MGKLDVHKLYYLSYCIDTHNADADISVIKFHVDTVKIEISPALYCMHQTTT